MRVVDDSPSFSFFLFSTTVVMPKSLRQIVPLHQKPAQTFMCCWLLPADLHHYALTGHPSFIDSFHSFLLRLLAKWLHCCVLRFGSFAARFRQHSLPVWLCISLSDVLDPPAAGGPPFSHSYVLLIPPWRDVSRSALNPSFRVFPALVIAFVSWCGRGWGTCMWDNRFRVRLGLQTWYTRR